MSFGETTGEGMVPVRGDEPEAKRAARCWARGGAVSSRGVRTRIKLDFGKKTVIVL